MDKDRTEGAAQKAGGRVKETVGKLTGDAKLKNEGKADRAVGSVRNAIGGAKDAIKGAGKDRRR